VGRHPCVCILTSGYLGTVYIGITSYLAERLDQHRSGRVEGFTSRYKLFRLVYFEYLADMPIAIAREKQLKAWHRDWKCNLIERDNPAWNDLAPGLGLAEALPSKTPSC